MAKNQFEAIIGAIILVAVVAVFVNTVINEFGSNVFINQSLFNFLLLILFIAFVIEALRRIVEYFN